MIANVAKSGNQCHAFKACRNKLAKRKEGKR